MGFRCQLFIPFGLHRLRHFVISKAILCLAKSLQCIVRAVGDNSEWCSWLTIRENSHNARTAPITSSSEAVSTAVFLSSLEPSRFGAQFTASVLIMPWIPLPCQELLFIESNGLEKRCRHGYRGTNANRLSNWFLTFLALRYLSRQRNKSLTKPRYSWCNSSGCQSW